MKIMYTQQNDYWAKFEGKHQKKPSNSTTRT